MGNSTRPQSQRSGAQSRGTDVGAKRGGQGRSRNTLKSNKDNLIARRDRYGSRHNEDDIKAQERRLGRPAGRDLAFREAGQDTQVNRGAKNKLPGRRNRRSGG